MRRAKPVWVVAASVGAQTTYPVAVMRGEDNPAFYYIEFKEWLRLLEEDAERMIRLPRRHKMKPRGGKATCGTREAQDTAEKTCKAKRQAFVQSSLIDAGLDPEWINCDSMKVFVAWLVKFKGYKIVRHETVALDPM